MRHILRLIKPVIFAIYRNVFKKKKVQPHSVTTRNQKSLGHVVYEQCFSTSKLYLLAVLNVIQHLFTEVLNQSPRGDYFTIFPPLRFMGYPVF